MSRRLMLALLLTGLLSMVVRADTDSRFTTIVRQDASGVVVQVRVPESAYAIALDPHGRRTVTVDGLPTAQVPGRPELPVVVLSLAVPEGAELSLRWDESAVTRHAGAPVRLTPASDRAIGNVERGAVPSAEVWPVRTVTVEELQFRDLRIARLTIHPVRYDAASRELLLIPELEVELTFQPADGSKASQGWTRPTGAWERQVASTLANRESLFAAPLGSAGLQPASPSEKSATWPALNIVVDEPGLVRVDRDLLASAGLSEEMLDDLDPRQWQLHYRQTPIPCRVTGEDDGSLDPGDALEFYGTAADSRFFSANTYRLTVTEAPGIRFATRSAAPGLAPPAQHTLDTRRFEGGNGIYSYGQPATEGDPHFFWVWFEDNPNPPRVTSFTHEVSLPGVDPEATGQATFRALFSGRTDPPEDPDHRVRFSVNGAEIGEAVWNGQGLHLAEVSFDPQLLLAGNNLLQFDYVSTAIVDIYYMDWIEVTYPRTLDATDDRLRVQSASDTATRYAVAGFGAASEPVVLDVSDPLSPVQLTDVLAEGGGAVTLSWEDEMPLGTRYLAVGDGGRVAPASIEVDTPSSLRDPAQGADLIVVVPDGWEDTLAPLVAHRVSQGLRVVVANLTDVADEFAGGNVDDVAIRDFVAWAYENWQPPAPSFLLLVGEPNLDVTNQMDRASHHHHMPTHFGVTVDLGETMTDTWFGAVAGNDLLPDLAVGRISVRSAFEAQNVVNKILSYETAPLDGATWNHNVVQVAANHALFEASLEESALLLPDHFTVDSQYRLGGATKASIQDAVGDGALLLSFTGHGNITYWADKPGGAFFTTTSVSGLGNPGRLPFVTAMNCLNGLTGHPVQQDSFAEKFVNHPELGAIAMWSPSALGFLSEYAELQSILYRRLFQDHEPVLGTTTTLSLVETFLTYPVSIDLVKEMIFTGDPAGFLVADSDADGSIDFHELEIGTHPGDRDTDDDGWIDSAETEPTADADADGLANALDADADNDGLADGLEVGLAAPDAGTDISQGAFRADEDPLSTTDPADPDSDGGGAPDGAEDRNANGRVDSGETDPNDPFDDPICSDQPPPEIAAQTSDQLRLNIVGSDITLDFGTTSDDPCLLFRVYVADDLPPGGSIDGFALHGVTGQQHYVHGAGKTDGLLHRYLIVGATPTHGEGDWGRPGVSP